MVLPNRSSGIGILYSRNSQQSLSKMADMEGKSFNFRGAKGTVCWLKGEYAYLAPNGAASLLRRLCIKFDWMSDEDLTNVTRLEPYHTLILPHCIGLPTRSSQILETWVKRGGHLLVTGQSDLPPELLGLSEVNWYQPKGYSAMRYGKYDLIVGYRGYTMGIGRVASGSQVLASAFEVSNPAEGVSGEDDSSIGPAVIQNGKVIYIGLPLFETFGALIQGHVNFEDMRVWGHRYKYLDWVCRCIKDLLEEAGWNHLWTVRVKPWGPYSGIVVLRHDVDSSMDTTYLDYEVRKHIPATYAILNDRHSQYWLKAVSGHPGAEASYHFDTTPEEGAKWSRNFKKGEGGTRRTFRKTSGKGLWRQFKKARNGKGIPIVTGQRHNSFFHYPEMIDAMDYLYGQGPEILGLGTMFRFTNFMYGARKDNDEGAYVIKHPDTSVPFWFPFKLCYASANGHHILRGWDITHVLEPEPWLTEHLLDQREYLGDGVYTLGFHPAHCWGKSFRPEGNWQWFEYAVEWGQSCGFLFATCREVFERISRWEYLGFGFFERDGWIGNQKVSYPMTVYLEHPCGELFFEKKKGSIESLNPTLTKLVLSSGDSVRFSVG